MRTGITEVIIISIAFSVFFIILIRFKRRMFSDYSSLPLPGN